MARLVCTCLQRCDGVARPAARRAALLLCAIAADVHSIYDGLHAVDSGLPRGEQRIPLSLHEQNALPPGMLPLNVECYACVMHCLTACCRCAGLLLCEHFRHSAAVCSIQYRQISEQEAWEVSPPCKKSSLALPHASRPLLCIQIF